MIIAHLTDGLGNQMFQYALAKALALKNNTEIIFDMSWYEINKYRGRRLYQLDIFPLNCKKINEAGKYWDWALKHLHFTRNIFRHKSQSKIRSLLGPSGISIKEKTPVYDDTVPEQAKNKNVCLTGYWQSEKYFSSIRQELLADFQFLPELVGKNLTVSQRIKSCANPVALHVRRGDYLATNFDVCGLDYYQRAVEYITGKVGDIQLFVFSNDIGWAKENIKTNQEIYFVDNNSEDNGYEDMRLMSLCRHHIIANSSFSWWGAWLGVAENKIVVAPKRWMVSEQYSYDDVVPSGWIRL
ncbi:Alpha-1,2-fucosyltransferase [Anaerovibrio sp. JC8]|uniref:alpha-1,2-fucosyltransferase n=1 Tax=Anaerovibrio sp. JC8 TaxID=1240085 RepID=UPI000A0AD0E8|nr:alpha-1,2-fucosyltransferase [Anaerovibrio sp. JC8]ORU01001.1 Alpha-1,2-fucosyltransferase [Anaerovibrio sp. JC8]